MLALCYPRFLLSSPCATEELSKGERDHGTYQRASHASKAPLAVQKNSMTRNPSTLLSSGQPLSPVTKCNKICSQSRTAVYWSHSPGNCVSPGQLWTPHKCKLVGLHCPAFPPIAPRSSGKHPALGSPSQGPPSSIRPSRSVKFLEKRRL